MTARRLAAAWIGTALLCGCGDSSPEARTVRRHLDTLSQGDASSRVAAASELGRLRATNAVPGLIAAAGDIRPDVRLAAVEALVEIADPRARDAFRLQLQSREWRARQLAAQGLGRIGAANAADDLRAALRDSHAAVAAAAAESLAACGRLSDVKDVACSTNEPVAAREAALLVLGEHGFAGLDAALAAARDTNAAVRAAGVAAVARGGGAQGAPALVDGLLDPSPAVRKACEKAILSMEPDAVLPALLAAIGKGGAEKQMAVLRMLEGDRTARGLGVLAAALVSESAAVRAGAGRILDERRRQFGKAGRDPRMLPVDPLLRAVSSTNPVVRAAALNHIERDAVLNRSVEPKLRDALKDSHPAVRAAAVRLLAMLAPESIERDLAPLLGDANVEVRRAAALPLASRTNEVAAEIVAQALSDALEEYNDGTKEKGRPETRERLAVLMRAAASGRSRSAVPAIVRCMETCDDELSATAISALGRIGDRSVYDKVVPYLGRNKWGEQHMKAAAVETLAALDPARAAGTLTELLAKEDMWQGEAALSAMCRTLARLKEPRAADPMIDRLHERYANQSGRMNEVKVAAAAGLVELGEAAVPAIVRRLNDTKVREGALAMILGRIGEPAVKPAIDALKSDDALIRKNAAWALGYMKARPDAIEALVGLLSDREAQVRTAAAWSLGQFKAERAVRALVPMLGSDSPRDRMAAAEALGRIGDVSAVTDLLGRLADPDSEVRFAAVSALGVLGDKSVVDPLKRVAVGDKEDRVRYAAGEALAALGVSVVTAGGK